MYGTMSLQDFRQLVNRSHMTPQLGRSIDHKVMSKEVGAPFTVQKMDWFGAVCYDEETSSRTVR